MFPDPISNPNFEEVKEVDIHVSSLLSSIKAGLLPKYEEQFIKLP